MKKVISYLLVVTLMIPATASADLFGGDVAVLVQILTQNIKQLIELQEILSNGKNTLSLIRDINRGINDSLNLIRTISPYVDPGQFAELKKVEDVLRKFGSVYGTVVSSPDAQAQINTDRAIAEAVTMNNAIFDYTKEIDKIGEDIKTFSHAVSPGGAQKLTAQSLGVMIHVLNQSLRAQGTLLKLQAQSLAQNNKKEKDNTAEYLKASNTLSNAMKGSSPKFNRPRF